MFVRQSRTGSIGGVPRGSMGGTIPQRGMIHPCAAAAGAMASESRRAKRDQRMNGLRRGSCRETFGAAELAHLLPPLEAGTQMEKQMADEPKGDGHVAGGAAKRPEVGEKSSQS